MTLSSTRSAMAAASLSRRSLLWGAQFLLVLGLSACGGGEPASSPETTPPPAPAASEGEAAEVVFEPAFPEEVSAEGLSSEDVEQAEAAHSEDGHSHDDGGHSHDDGGHSHDDGGHDEEGHDDAGHAEDGHDHQEGEGSHGEE